MGGDPQSAAMPLPNDAPDYGSLPLNPEFVPGTPEYVEKRARLKEEIRARIDRGEGRLEVEAWLDGEGIDPGDATRMVDAVVRPPAANPLRDLPPEKSVTDPEFAFAANATSAEHIRAKELRSWYLFRVVAFVPITLVVGFVLYLLFTPLKKLGGG
jgi:hypothetical protein